jgi:hypothetical protein
MKIAMPSDNADRADDTLTLIAIAVVAYIISDIAHEAVGHGVVAWLSGAHRITLSTLALQSDIETRPISAAGTIVNLITAAIFWLLLRRPARYKPATRYFLVIALAGNLFTATGYFFFSGVANFGDWAAVIRGLQPQWLWRVGLIVLGVISYAASMRVVGHQLAPFVTGGHRARLRRLCWIAYFAEGILAAIAGLPNPLGFFYVVASGLSSTLGAKTGLFVMPFVLPAPNVPREPSVTRIARNVAWIITAGIAGMLFIAVLGRGITFSP